MKLLSYYGVQNRSITTAGGTSDFRLKCHTVRVETFKVQS